ALRHRGIGGARKEVPSLPRSLHEVALAGDEDAGDALRALPRRARLHRPHVPPVPHGPPLGVPRHARRLPDARLRPRAPLVRSPPPADLPRAAELLERAPASLSLAAGRRLRRLTAVTV